MTRPLIILCLLIALAALIGMLTDHDRFYSWWAQKFDGSNINNPNNG